MAEIPNSPQTDAAELSDLGFQENPVFALIDAEPETTMEVPSSSGEPEVEAEEPNAEATEASTEVSEESEEVPETTFTPITIPGYGVEDDVVIESEDQLRELAQNYRNDKKWVTRNQELGQKLNQERAAFEQESAGWKNIIEKMRSLPPDVQSAFNDVLVNGTPLEKAVEIAKMRFGGEAEPDQNDDPLGHLQWQNRQLQKQILQMQQGQNGQNKSETKQPKAHNQEFSPAEKALFTENDQTYNERMSVSWPKEYPSIDWKSPEVQKLVGQKITQTLRSRGISAEALFQQRLVPEFWDGVLSEALPKLVATKSPSKPKKVLAKTLANGARSAGGAATNGHGFWADVLFGG